MAFDGLSIGLFGGSFNPAHAGHVHVARCGLSRLQLDHIWWMVSPQNPLKPAQPPYEARVASVEALNLPYRMTVSHMERDFGTRYTIDTIHTMQSRYPRTRFVFLMGADNFAQLPLWKDWQEIMARIPIAVIGRPGKDGRVTIRPRLSKAAKRHAWARLPESAAHKLQYYDAPVWTYLTPPLNPLSSTAIRAGNH